MKLSAKYYRHFVLDRPFKVLSSSEAALNLATSAEILRERLSGTKHDLWDSRKFYVAPMRIDFAKELKTKNESDWSALEVDLVMFRCFSTMGGLDTFKYISHPFFANCANYNENAGWMSESHVILGKFEQFSRTDFELSQYTALLDAIESFAALEIAIDSEEEYHGRFVTAGKINVLQMRLYKDACRLFAFANEQRGIKTVQ